MRTYYSDQIDEALLSTHEKDLIYNSLDTLVTKCVEHSMLSSAQPDSLATYEISRAMLGPAYDMMQRGILIDTAARDEEVAKLAARRVVVQAFLDRHTPLVWGRTLNYKSPKQMKEFFYDWLFIPPIYENKKGERKISTGRKPLERMIKDHARAIPFARAVLRLRDLDKMIDVLTKGLSPTGRWHASFNIGGTDTWRWSSSSHPFGYGANLQNIDDTLRRVFIPDPGFVLWSCDLIGADAYVVAYESGDENYINAILSGDLHTQTAAAAWGFEPIRALADRVFYRGKTYRDMAKKFAHGSNYLGKAVTIASQAGVETSLVETFQRKYFKKYPGIRAWQEAKARQLQTKGYIVTPFGDRRQFWGRLTDDATLRQAVAFSPQSTVGKLTAIGLYRVWDTLPHSEVQILNNVHDAAIGQIRKSFVAEGLPLLLECLKTPLEVTDINGKTRTMEIPWELSLGANWGKRIKEKDGSITNANGLAKHA